MGKTAFTHVRWAPSHARWPASSEETGSSGSPGQTIVEEAGHYANEENLYVSATKRASGEPATDEDANA